MEPETCELWGRCGGCPWGGIPLDEQRRRKIAAVERLGVPVEFAPTPGLRLRDRADLIWQRFGDGMRLGLYALNEPGVVDLPGCPMMSPRLEAFFKDFRRLTPPITKGSVRLRVAPDGARGAWLDFANVDVKTLFEEQTYIRGLSELAFVEIGQRRKRLIWDGDRPRLVDPELRPWFKTYDAEGAAIPLFGPVGGFTQSGFVGNRALVEAVTRAATRADVTAWLELFGGSGNFALALAARGWPVELVEVDALAVAGAERALEGRAWPVEVRRLDAYRGPLPEAKGRGVLVDPPRAGLRETFGWLERERPPAVLYVSCFTDAFLTDVDRLRGLGYRLESLAGVDQFAQSPHGEWVALFKF